jgi:hypothetical protein
MKTDPIPILLLRRQPVILDADLAMLYGVTTKRLNEQVKRNAERFPEDFVFVFNKDETGFLKSQYATSKIKSLAINELTRTGRGGRRKLPLAFTEHGAWQRSTIPCWFTIQPCATCTGNCCRCSNRRRPSRSAPSASVRPTLMEHACTLQSAGIFH